MSDTRERIDTEIETSMAQVRMIEDLLHNIYVSAPPTRRTGEADDTHSRAVELTRSGNVLSAIANLRSVCRDYAASTDLPGMRDRIGSFLNDLDEIVHDNLPTRDRWEAKIRGE
jgi:hypothetical protein